MDPGFFQSLERGVGLFNAQDFYEAHEAWEAGWIDELCDERRLLQGLIQVAAGFHKLQGGLPRGTVKLLEQGLAKLRDFREKSLGVDLEVFIPEVESWLEKARKLVAEGQTAYEPAHLPKVQYRPPSSALGTGQ